MWGMGSVGWYRTYSDSWLEQGDLQATSVSYTTKNLVKSYTIRDTMKIYVSIQRWDTTSAGGNGGFGNVTGAGYYTTSSIYFDAAPVYPWVYMVEGY